MQATVPGNKILSHLECDAKSEFAQCVYFEVATIDET